MFQYIKRQGKTQWNFLILFDNILLYEYTSPNSNMKLFKFGIVKCGKGIWQNSNTIPSTQKYKKYSARYLLKAFCKSSRIRWSS